MSKRQDHGMVEMPLRDGHIAASTRLVWVDGIRFQDLSLAEAVELLLKGVMAGTGGAVVTPNLDILRLCHERPELRDMVLDFDLVLADGAPVVWASAVAGCALRERVPGSDLVPALTAACATDGIPVLFLGGGPGVAQQAAEANMRIWGRSAPTGHYELPYAEIFDVRDLDGAVASIVRVKAKLVFVGLGFPKQERVILTLTRLLPEVWFLGVGAALDFEAGRVRRAPKWLRKLGLEWSFRLMLEPRRLGQRYLMRDLPYAWRLLVAAALVRVPSRRTRQAPPGLPTGARTAAHQSVRGRQWGVVSPTPSEVPLAEGR